MEIFIARQPVFNRRKELFGYELLHRSNMENVFPEADGDTATSRLLVNTFLNIGLEKIVSSRWALINFTEEHLLEKTALNLPSENVIVEVLEDVSPSPEIVAVCKELKEKGYTLALDDFVFAEGLEPLVELADIIKIDFQALSEVEIREEIKLLQNQKVQLLAEKIETYAQFDAAWKMGFHLFQGYFFSQPEMLKNKEIPASKMNQLALLAEANRKEADWEKIEQLIAADVSTSYKLLRYINSAYYYRLNKVKSIKYALAFLGESGIRQFVSLVVTSQMSVDKPYELLRTSITRARFCELLGKYGSKKHDGAELFLMGLFSLLSAMLDMPMIDIMEQLPLPSDIKECLADGSGPYFPYLEAMLAYENGDWKNCRRLFGELNIRPGEVVRAYMDSLSWADRLSGDTETS